jgi:GR25 family glycosyltransferase involved in LPS biosynthesis
MLIQIVTINKKEDIKKKYENLLDLYDYKIFIGTEEYIKEEQKITGINLKISKNILLNQAEINLASAHLCMLIRLVLSKHNYSLILEDDAKFNINTLTSFLDKVILEDHNGFYLLGHSKTILKYQWFENLKYPIKNKFLIGGVYAGENENRYPGTVGYLVSRNAAYERLKELEIKTVSDDWQFIKNFSKVYSLNKRIIHEEMNLLNTYSSTGNLVFVHHNPFSRRFLYEWGFVIKCIIKKILFQ